MNTRLVRAPVVRLACRVVIAAGGAAMAWLAAGPGPAGPALAVGAGTWFVLTARRDLSRSRDDTYLVRPGRGRWRRGAQDPMTRPTTSPRRARLAGRRAPRRAPAGPR